MDPRTVLKEVHRLKPKPRVPEDSPATHLAKLRRMKKEGDAQKYEDAVNDVWRKRYIRIFEKER